LTTYWAKVASEHLDVAVDLIADMATAPRLDDDELEKEKKVVIEELGLAYDSPGEWVHQLLSESLWPDQPLGREIAGTRATVNAQTPASLASYLRRTHGLSNAVLAIAGDADPDHVIALATDRLGQRSGPPPSWTPALGVGGPPRVVTETRATEQAYLAIAGYGLPRGHPDRYVLRVLNSVLGDGMSSRLFLEVRERRGLTYDIASYLANFHDTGALAIHAGVEPERTMEAVAAIVCEVAKLLTDLVPDHELRKVKAYLRGRTLLSLEDSSSVASWSSNPALLGIEERTPDEVLESIDAVTAADVQRVANELLRPGSLHLAHIGPPIDRDHLQALLLA
jgi:predicted Zn-dependent peptidase